MTQPPQTLKGFRDFLPAEKRQRDWVTDRIKAAFELYGFEPLETPTLEYAALLLGKYGTEADKLVYTFADKGERNVGLRYDQTVPTARVLGQYQNELPRLFRRYQIQNVFRADKPQKGRYREFTQCDCDIFGSTSPLADAEILAVYYAANKSIGFESLVIEINDRQSLFNFVSPFATVQVGVMSLIQSLDKLDKQSPKEVSDELVSKGLELAAAEAIVEGIEKVAISDQLKQIEDMAIRLGIPRSALVFNPKLARGLDYYTGLIFEGKVPEYAVGSVGGGGRYDHLLNDLAGVDVPAVGFAIGFDRVVEAAVALGLTPPVTSSAQVLVAIQSEVTISTTLEVAAQLRAAGVATELYPALDKLAKQFKLADQKNIPFVVVVGEDEIKQNKVMLKNMGSGEQELLTINEVVAVLQSSEKR